MKLLIYQLIIFFLILIQSIRSQHRNYNYHQSDLTQDEIKLKWHQMLSQTKRWIQLTERNYDFDILTNDNLNLNVSKQCKHALLSMFSSAKRFEYWAIASEYISK